MAKLDTNEPQEAQEALLDYLLRIADNVLVLGQRMSEWTGHSPAIELDMAATNISLDLIGQAQHFLGYAGEVEGKGRDADALAFLRDAFHFRNILLVEQNNGDWADTTVRLYLFTAFHTLLLEALKSSSDARLAAIAEKALIEARYHEDFARDWMVRLGDGTEESHDRMQGAIEFLWHLTGEMFEADGVDDMMVANGTGADLAALQAAWEAKVQATLAEAGLTAPDTPRWTLGGKQGHHSEHLGHMLSEMQFLQRAYPNCEW